MTTITAPTDLAAVLTTEHMLHYLATATTLDALHRSWLRLFLAAGRAAVTSLRYDTLFPLTGVSVFATVVSTYDQVATSFTKVIAGHGSLDTLGVALENAVRARANAVQVLCHYERQVRRDVAVVLPYVAPPNRSPRTGMADNSGPDSRHTGGVIPAYCARPKPDGDTH